VTEVASPVVAAGEAARDAAVWEATAAAQIRVASRSR
jgi:hypothetical protein